MSTPSTAGATPAEIEAYLDQFNFTGGNPTSKDLAPSIVFSIIYCALLAAVTWRWAMPATRTRLLIRPTIFIVIRIASWVLRAVMSKTPYGTGELIAELVFISIGFLFIISPVIDMWRRHVLSEVAKNERPQWLLRLTNLAQLTLVAAIITATIGGSLVGTSVATTTITGLRKASYVLSLAVVVLALIGIMRTHRIFHLQKRGTYFLIAISLFCMVCGVYRVVQIFTTDPKDPVRNYITFYILQGAMEVCATIPMLAININEWFPGEQGAAIRSHDSESGYPMTEQQQK
ncbi:hypothetical protein Q8F55_004358 [Vanrija albida]|uniref:DUF7702 domain-containing protein n=1 Tax=Vanrija albida TaxID=181172 RepID=A0ABR3Q6I0_9TREE